MRVVVVTPPPAIVTLEQAKAHLRVDGIDDDALIEGYVAAATGLIDGPAGWLGRAIGLQTLEAYPDATTCRRSVRLPYPPLVAVEAVDRRVGDRHEPFPTDQYAVEGQQITFRYLSTTASAPIRIRYRAGYDVPPPAVVTAVLLMVGQFFANRDGGKADFAAAEMLLTPLRVYS